MIPSRSAPPALPLLSHTLDVKIDTAIQVLGTNQPVTMKTQSVVNKARRRHRDTSYWFGHLEDVPKGGDFSIGYVHQILQMGIPLVIVEAAEAVERYEVAFHKSAVFIQRLPG